MNIFSILTLAREKGASDIHLTPGSHPTFRINGSLVVQEDMPIIDPDDAHAALRQLTDEKQQSTFARKLELDFGYTQPGVGRLRCNAARQQGTISFAIRVLPGTIPSIDDLGLPQICKDLALKPRGMVVITGPTGSGKSTTLASMVQYLNTVEMRRVVTIEDPIEYQYPGGNCTVVQRQLGDDTLSFSQALKHVLRQDPDVILVGEMRDVETAAAAMNIAETGHLVFTTGHANSAPQAVERIIDLFPPHERHMAQTSLASLLLGIVCQTLVPRADGGGRVPAVEVMLANPPVRSLIREGKIYQLPNVIRTYTSEGMCLLDQSLMNLCMRKAITYEKALAFCHDPNELEKSMGAAQAAVRARANGASEDKASARARP